MVRVPPDLIRTRPVALCVVQDVAGVLWDEEAWRWQVEPGEAKHWNEHLEHIEHYWDWTVAATPDSLQTCSAALWAVEDGAGALWEE
jgi:hypothetical protein